MRSCVLSGPSVVGKTWYVRRLVQEHDFFSPRPLTTRPARPGILDLHEYDHLTRQQMHACLEADTVLAETTLAHTYAYWAGVPRLFVPGACVVLHALARLALRIRDEAPEAPLLIFLQHPSDALLRSRLKSRYGHDRERYEARLAHAEDEARHAEAFDHVITVDTYEEGFKALLEALRTNAATH